MKRFRPEQAFFEKEALEYPLGKRMHTFLQKHSIPITIIPSHNRVTGIPGANPMEAYRNAKRTIVVGIKRTMELDICKPSANYQFSLSTGCVGGCHYCYLQTTMGKKPYIRIYVNTDEIFDNLNQYIEKRAPRLTFFESSSSSDPVGVEHMTGSLKKAIEFFAKSKYGRLRIVTKFAQVDSLLDIHHNQHTRFRFSLNSDYVIRNFEQMTATLEERIEAAGKIAQAGYPLGFILAPIMHYEGWQDEYSYMLSHLSKTLANTSVKDLTFELIQYRFTKAAKNIILERFPNTKLDMDESNRKYKWGKYGRGKWVYPDEKSKELDQFIRQQIKEKFPAARVQYFT
ncbi:spore photoproduct lyase [Desulfuribacillus stibiiarsenatis]|uniref:spore photoproduct lyase n=1 Tax=Desulfuribacillus stibiiarsenatis TaxID=1390249 RepID=UPI000AE5D157|nr:spore photoproduct lyase [Desulfuribacillus stibiiarsenatis]